MKARLPVNAAAKRRLLEEQERLMQQIIRRFMKITCCTLNEEFGFGKQRLAKYILQFSNVAGISSHDEEYWYHVDERIKQLGLDFENEDYDELREFANRRKEDNEKLH